MFVVTSASWEQFVVERFATIASHWIVDALKSVKTSSELCHNPEKFVTLAKKLQKPPMWDVLSTLYENIAGYWLNMDKKAKLNSSSDGYEPGSEEAIKEHKKRILYLLTSNLYHFNGKLQISLKVCHFEAYKFCIDTFFAF